MTSTTKHQHPAAAATLAAANGYVPGPGSSFRAHMRASSAAHLAATGRPLRRMSVAATLRRSGTEEDGRNTVPFWINSDGYLTMHLPASDGPAPATAEAIHDVFNDPRYLPMPLDANVAGSMKVMCENAAASQRLAPQRAVRDDLLGVAREINVAVRLPVTSRLLVLSRALARAYWQPSDRKADIGSWVSMLGVTNDVTGWRALAKDVLDTQPLGEPSPPLAVTQAKAIEKIEDSMSKTIRKAGATSAATLYAKQESLAQAWSCIERVDPLLRPQFVASGEVVKLTNATMLGTKLEANLASPCKVKPGEVLVLFADTGDSREADLSAMDFNDNGLVGRFSGRGHTGLRRNTAGATLALMAGRECYITARPFTGAGGTNSVFRWVTTDQEQLPKLTPLEIPLDIAIAGAPVGD